MLASTAHPVRRVFFPKLDTPAKGFTVTLHAATDTEAAKRAKEILRDCHRGRMNQYGKPTVAVVPHPGYGSKNNMRNYKPEKTHA